MARTPEGKVEDHLFDQCGKLDFVCLKFTSPANSGVPDRVIIGNGLTVFLELKAPGKTLRALQHEVVTEMVSHGAIVRVANTKALVDELLAEMVAGTVSSTVLPERRKKRVFTPQPGASAALLRDQLALSLPKATPAQVDELVDMATKAGRNINAAHKAAASTSP
ncbi:VRR-NUC domain-containing protein [Micrococcaceae bacterium Sec7.4]